MGYFLGTLKFRIFFEVFEIPDIFWVKGRCWARAYVCRKIESRGDRGKMIQGAK